jgi:hypothetical protein
MVLETLRLWITADNRYVAQSVVVFVALAAGIIVGALFGGLGWVIALGVCLTATLGILILQSTQVGLFSLIALICLLPYGALPFTIGFRPTFLDVALLALFGVWLMQFITGKQRYFITSPLGPLVLAFQGWALFVFIFGLRFAGLNLTITRNFLEVLLSVSLFFLALNQIKTEAQLTQISRAIILLGGGTAALGIFFYVIPENVTIRLLSLLRIFQYPTEGILRYIEDNPEQPMRAIATSIDPNALGGLMVFLTIIAIAHLFAPKPILARRYLMLISAMMTITLYLTYSRGALLGVVAGLGVMSLLRYRQLIWLMVVAVILVLILPQTQFYVTRFIDGIQGQDLATQMRFGEYKDALELISRYPLTGVGFFGTPDIDLYVGVSSVYLLIAQQMGVIGAGLYILVGLAYIVLMYLTLRRLPRGHVLETPLLAYGLAILGAMVSGVFDHFYFNLQFIHIATLYWLTIGLGMVAHKLVMSKE